MTDKDKTDLPSIEDAVGEFIKSSDDPTHRYASFDYCYSYFFTSSSEQLKANIEKSCLVLGFYLASWGMLRASSFLLSKSIKYYQPLIEYIATLNKDLWQIDVNNYDDENINRICCLYQEIKNQIIKGNNRDITLVTKIMLGVFGMVPAFDENFLAAYKNVFECSKPSTITRQELIKIRGFYNQHKNFIDSKVDTTFVLDFKTGKKTGIKYTRAKIIDMYGFICGDEINKELEKQRKITKGKNNV